MIFGTGLSIYAYRENLTDGFDKGLTRAMQHYRNDTDHLAVNFDRMQQAVSICFGRLILYFQEIIVIYNVYF